MVKGNFMSESFVRSKYIVNDFKINIRTATIADVPAIIPLIQQLGYPTSEDEFRLRFQRFTQNSGYGVAVASINSQVVGWVAWSKSELLVLSKTRFNIEGLVVHEQHRGKGIGKKLMTFVEEVASRFSPSVIDVISGVRRAKEGVHEFYKCLGYNNYGRNAKIFFRKDL
jgi:GNAT superfamily N-acetyltransferase